MIRYGNLFIGVMLAMSFMMLLALVMPSGATAPGAAEHLYASVDGGKTWHSRSGGQAGPGACADRLPSLQRADAVAGLTHVQYRCSASQPNG